MSNSLCVEKGTEHFCFALSPSVFAAAGCAGDGCVGHSGRLICRFRFLLFQWAGENIPYLTDKHLQEKGSVFCAA